MLQSPTPFIFAFSLLFSLECISFFLIAPFKNTYYVTFPFNSAVLVLFIMSTAYILNTLCMLYRDKKWLSAWSKNPDDTTLRTPKFLAPLANLNAFSKAETFFTNISAYTFILNQIQARLKRCKQIGHYGIGALLCVGLLGTFWNIVYTPQFGTLILSPSLMGLIASIVLGCFNLLVSLAGQRLFFRVEQKLLLRLHVASTAEHSSRNLHVVPQQTNQPTVQTSQHSKKLARIEWSSEDRATFIHALTTLSEKLSYLVNQHPIGKHLLLKAAESLVELQSLISQLRGCLHEKDFGLDPRVRTHIRNFNTMAPRLNSKLITAGHSSLLKELCNEMRLLRRTLSCVSPSSHPKRISSLGLQESEQFSPLSLVIENESSRGYYSFQRPQKKMSS